jgi:NAD(P)H dehydrogenase (quinone)
MTEILVLYYSQQGNTQKLARHIARGIESIDNCVAKICTVNELNRAQTLSHDDPIATLEDLQHCDGLAMGSPVHFGNMAAPLKHFIDQTTPLWLNGTLIGKPACVFSSGSSLHGGQETTLQTMMLPLLHHGMLILGLPYSEAALHTTQTGGSPYGATHFNNTNQNMALSLEEKNLAFHQGKRLANIAKKLNQS